MKPPEFLPSMLGRVITVLDAISTTMGRSVSWLSLVLVLLTGFIVLQRYLFQSGSIALQESLIYINALIITVGAAYTLKEKAHVRVDIFYNRLGEKGRAVVDLLGVALFLLPCTIFILWQSWDYVALSWRIKESSAELSGLPIVYLLKTTILVLPGLLLVQSFSELSKALKILFFDAERNSQQSFSAAQESDNEERIVERKANRSERDN